MEKTALPATDSRQRKRSTTGCTIWPVPPTPTFVSDTRNNLVRKIDGRTNITSTIAGIPGKGFSGDGGLASRAKLADPISISLSPDEKTLLIADIHNRRIRAVDLTNGLIRTVAGNGRRGIPKGGEIDSTLPIHEPARWTRKETFMFWNAEETPCASSGLMANFHGCGHRKEGSRDGYARKSTFSGPKHLCIDRRQRHHCR